MGSVRSFVILAVAVFAGALTGAMIGSGPVAQAAAEPAAAVADIPRGAVVAFDRANCPIGWSVFTQAQGRTIVGLNDGGTLRARVGVKLGDKEVRKHNHRVDPNDQSTGASGEHAHKWLSYNDGQFFAGNGREFVKWGNGMDAVGEGFYPIAVDFIAGPNLTNDYHTDQTGGHSHLVDIEETTSTATWNRFPFVQLLMCEKD